MNASGCPCHHPSRAGGRHSRGGAGTRIHPGRGPGPFRYHLSPCADFFRYANGGWEARTEIPPQYTSYGVGREIQDRTEALLQQDPRGCRPRRARVADSTTRLSGCFTGAAWTRSGPAESTPRRSTAAPPHRGDKHPGDLAEVLGELQRQGMNVGIATFAYPDLAHSDTLRLNLYQGSYGLPDRDYYPRTDSAFVDRAP